MCRVAELDPGVDRRELFARLPDLEFENRVARLDLEFGALDLLLGRETWIRGALACWRGTVEVLVLEDDVASPVLASDECCDPSNQIDLLKRPGVRCRTQSRQRQVTHHAPGKAKHDLDAGTFLLGGTPCDKARAAGSALSSWPSSTEGNAHFSISKSHGAKPSPSNVGVVPVVRLPKTSRVASCSSTKRIGLIRSRGARSSRARGPPLRLMSCEASCKSSCQPSSPPSDFDWQRDHRGSALVGQRALG